MTKEIPTPYRELAAIIDNLPFLIRHTRRARGLSLRAAAGQIGTDNSTLYRIECGNGYTAAMIPPILTWLDQSRPVDAHEATMRTVDHAITAARQDGTWTDAP